MVTHLYCADQTAPFELLKKFFKTKSSKVRISHYLNRLNAIGAESVDTVFAQLSKKGCTYAFVTNILINQFLGSNNYVYEDEKFKETFGFSLMVDNETIDYNILMIDIFQTLYNVVKMDIHSYQVYYYNDAIEAANALLQVKCEIEREASLKLFEAGLLLDGRDVNGKAKFKKMQPENKSVYGTYEEIASNLFDITKENFTMEKLKEQFVLHHATFDVSFADPESKFSGLLTANTLHFWLRYYLDKKGIDLTFDSDNIEHDFDSYEYFMIYIQNLLNDGYTVGVSSSPNSSVHITSEKGDISTGISDKRAGHQMTLLGFNENGDIIVDSWGRKFIISKIEYKELKFVYVKVNYANDLTNECNSQSPKKL